MGHRGYGPHRQWGTGVWGIWAMRPTGGIGTGVWGTWGMGYKGYGPCGQWDTWAMGYRGMSHMGKGPMGDLLPRYQKDVKLSKRCQVVKKMSNVKK